jgi:hypothetical protein
MAITLNGTTGITTPSDVTITSSGGGNFVIQPPNSATDRTLTLPDSAGTMMLTDTGVTTAQMPAGSVIQVVSSTNNTLNTTSNTSWTATSLSLSITPTSVSSKILLLSTASVGMGTANVANFAFARNGTILNGGGQGWGASFLITSASGANFGYPWSENWLDSPATTSAITYAVYFRVDSGGPAVFNGRGLGNSGAATLIAMEIAS